MDGAPGGLQSMGSQRVGHDWACMQAYKGRNQALFDYSQSFLQHLALGYFQQLFNFSLCYHKTAINLKLTFIFSISFSFSPGSTVTFFLLWSSSAMLRALGQDIMRYLYISMEEFCLLSFASVMDWHCGSVCSVTFKRTHFWVGGVFWKSCVCNCKLDSFPILKNFYYGVIVLLTDMISWHYTIKCDNIWKNLQIQWLNNFQLTRAGSHIHR